MSEISEWLIILPDIKDMLKTRMDVRKIHMEEMLRHINSGLFQMGGAILDKPAEAGVSLGIKGSCIIAKARTKEEILDVLRQDVYSREGVWDWREIQIYPFLCAYRSEIDLKTN